MVICYKTGTEISNRFFNRRFRRFLSLYRTEKPAHKKSRVNLARLIKNSLTLCWIYSLLFYESLRIEELSVLFFRVVKKEIAELTVSRIMKAHSDGQFAAA